MPYRVAADLVLSAHFLFAAFATFGGVLVFRNAAWAWVHVPVVLWSSAVNLMAWTCPLTPLEKSLRARAGQSGYSGGFIEHYVGRAVYPGGMPRRLEMVAGISILLWNVIVYAGALAWANRADASTLDCRSDSAVVQDIRAVATGIIAADNESDIERVLAYYAEDAILMPPGETPVTGRENFRPRYAGLFADFTPEIEGHIEEACAGGAMGFVRGHNGGRLVPRGDGSPRLLDDAYLMLLRRETGGAWRISHLIWHRQSE